MSSAGGQEPRLPSATLVEALVVAAGAFVLAILATWPLVTMFGSGWRFENNDAYFSVWRIGWMARTIVVDPAHLFDANIFAPHPNTLAYSESTVGLGALAAPAYWSTGNAVAAHNTIVLLAFATSAICAYFLARRLTNSRPAAIVSAVLFAYCPYVFGRLSHIHLIFTAGLPLSLLAFHAWVDRPSLPRALGLGLALVVTSATSGYYGIFAGVSVGIAWIFYAVYRSQWRATDYWMGGLVAAGTWALLMLPLYRPHWQLRQNQFQRTLDDARMWSADWPAYLASSAWAHRWLHPLIGSWSDTLFPGFIAIVLAGIGVATLRSRSGTREAVLFYLLLAVFAFWMSFGPKAGLYTAMFHAIPLFSWMRTPSRFAIVFALALSVLAGVAVASMLRRLPAARSVAVAIGLASVAWIELATLPLPLTRQPIPAIYDTLAKLPPGAVVELPFHADRQSYHAHTLYMYYSTRHWLPLVNGYSDYLPPDFRRLATKMAEFPDDESLAMLRTRAARYVLVHRGLYPVPARERIMRALDSSPDLRPITGGADIRLYGIVGGR